MPTTQHKGEECVRPASAKPPDLLYHPYWKYFPVLMRFSRRHPKKKEDGSWQKGFLSSLQEFVHAPICQGHFKGFASYLGKKSYKRDCEAPLHCLFSSFQKQLLWRALGMRSGIIITCYILFCPTPDARPAEAVHPGCARVTVPGQGCANLKRCLLLHMTLQQSRTKGA